MASVDWELQKAIYTALTTDGTLMALISGVFDYVPEDTGLDYVTIGDNNVQGEDRKTENGFEVYVDIESWSDNAGRAKVKQIQGEIYRVIHHTALTITGFTHIKTVFESSLTFRDQDETTWRGVQTFKVLISE